MVRFAYVRFREDNVQSIVDISCVERFDPATHHESKMYMVYWSPEHPDKLIDTSDEEPEKFKAQILLLGETKEEIENKIMSGPRVRIPKILDSSMETEEDEDITCGPPPSKKSAPSRLKRTEQAAKAAALEKIMAEKMKKRASSMLPSTSPPIQIIQAYTARPSTSFSRSSTSSVGPSTSSVGPSTSSVGPSTSSRPSTPSPRPSTPSPRHSTSASRPSSSSSRPSTSGMESLLKENAALKKELMEEKRRNKDFQDRIFERFDGLEATLENINKNVLERQAVDLPQQRPAEEDHPAEEREGDDELRFHPVEGQVSLGFGVKLATARFDMIMCQPKNSLFVKNLAVAIWGSEVLRQRSITGKNSNRYKDRPVFEPLEAEKLKALQGCFLHRLNKQPLSAEEKKKELSKVNTYISEKIMDLRRK